ncbi:hypothetical protein MLD38_040275 [Melastoma candidum]|uniref:Uncharacterized protein n=1 Tax=Melastoma candidum TaxID=119954 RepID=A0ACB9L5I7_9MYRT|nr:hypothetical protein MLD38_040275 [Melastoma candidum]
MSSLEATALSLLSAIDPQPCSSGRDENLSARFSEYLAPFSDPLLAANSREALALTRSLAKRFLPFLNRSLSAIPKVLSVSSSSGNSCPHAAELLVVYELCLRCLRTLSSQISCEPYTIETQWLRMVMCMESCGRFLDGFGEGIGVLERLLGIKKEIRSDCHGEFARVVVETGAVAVRCATKSLGSDGRGEEVFLVSKVMWVVEEIREWYGVLDTEKYEKLHGTLVTYLGKCASFLIDKWTRLDMDLMRKFFRVLLDQYGEGKFKLSRRMCFAILSSSEDRTSLLFELLSCLLESPAGRGKVKKYDNGKEFVELISYCTNNCWGSGQTVRYRFSVFLRKLAISKVLGLPLCVVLHLYSIGLRIVPGKLGQALDGSNVSNEGMPSIISLIQDGNILSDLPSLLCSLDSHFKIEFKEDNLDTEDPICDFSNQAHNVIYPSRITLSFKQRIDKANLRSYLSALKYLCSVLAELVNSERKDILSTCDAGLSHHMLCVVQDTFYRFCDVSLYHHRQVHEKEEDVLEENCKTVALAAIAAFTLSLVTKHQFQKSIHILRYIVSREWMQSDGVKTMIIPLYNVGVFLWRNWQIKEASIALKLSNEASWVYIKHMGEKTQENIGQGDPSGDAFIDVCNKTISRCAFYLDVLQQCDREKVEGELTCCLKNWLHAKNLSASLPAPMPLVKQWAKSQCEQSAVGDSKAFIPNIYELLSSSEGISGEALAVISEQEIFAYEEAKPLNPEFSKKMQMNIINVLLKDIYVTEEKCLQKARLLIIKARVLRSCGIEQLSDCIQCLSLAISAIEAKKRQYLSISEHNELAQAYCFRALCHYELDPASEAVNEDIHTALNLWSSDKFSGNCFPDNGVELALPLLYNVLDLVSVKGNIDDSMKLFKVMISIDKVVEAALGLVSFDCEPSLLAVGNLCYDLSERLASIGRLHEALFFSKKSHRLRFRLFQKKFTFSIGQRFEDCEEGRDIMRRFTEQIEDLQVSGQAAAGVWPISPKSSNFDELYLSPWITLQAYLESTLQVGLNYELIGNATKAEHLLQWGKSISLTQSLSHFVAAFSSGLARIFCKKHQWDLAWSELQKAQHIVKNGAAISCLKCKLLLETDLNLKLGDLSRSRLHNGAGLVLIDQLAPAEELYNSALDKLHHCEWKDLVPVPFDANAPSQICEKASEFIDSAALNVSLGSARELPKDVGVRNRNGKIKKEPKPKQVPPECSRRVTRSISRSFNQNKRAATLVTLKTREGNDVKTRESTKDEQDAHTYKESLKQQSSSGTFCICSQLKSCQHLPATLVKPASLNDVITLRWELSQRRVSSKLLTGLGKCHKKNDHHHETHEILRRCIANLTCQNPYWDCSASVASLIDLIGKDISEDVLAIERAEVLYLVCWFSLRQYDMQKPRFICCTMPSVQLPQIASWLKVAFALCREVPLLIQKVSRLLALVYIYLASRDQLSSSEIISENAWASFFHQVSVTAHINDLFHLNQIEKQHESGHAIEVKGSSLLESSSLGSELYNAHRHLDSSGLCSLVRAFFGGLPHATMICLSFISGIDSLVVRHLFGYPSSVSAWILLSRFRSSDQPILVLLPLSSIDEETTDCEDSSDHENITCSKCSDKDWNCPWGYAIIDELVPPFREILKKNHLSSSVRYSEDMEEHRRLWWSRRRSLDTRLQKLLRRLEEVWLGPWSCLLLGGRQNCEDITHVHKNMSREMRVKCNTEVESSLLGLVLEATTMRNGGEVVIPPLQSNCTCYIGKLDEHNEKTDGLASHLICESLSELQIKQSINREPVILVLDWEVQMIPWESMPTLRKQVVYRMPCGAKTFMKSTKSDVCQDLHRKAEFHYPAIDPLDAFYLLNPSGDLDRCQSQFENWFRDQKMEGCVGCAPTAKELSLALKSHDLFLYFGHGSGESYIPRNEIQKLEKCAATLLMGCSSGSVVLHGPYLPQGMSLSCLLAGSPVVIANLWDVTDKDIDRFGKTMLDAWLEERSKPRVCTMCVDSCCHRPTVASFMGKARDACALPFLIGAAPVCYGVPTEITRKKKM